MSIIEIIFSVFIVLLSFLIIYVFMYHESKDDGMTTALSGGYKGSYAAKNNNSRQKKVDGLIRNFEILFVLVISGYLMYCKYR